MEFHCQYTKASLVTSDVRRYQSRATTTHKITSLSFYFTERQGTKLDIF